ncbi:MAG: hypothetical protein H7249_12890 [Chitinophagaceae bacterium]|nr:hypothetical protein [Oligoflexus sp.]
MIKRSKQLSVWIGSATLLFTVTNCSVRPDVKNPVPSASLNSPSSAGGHSQADGPATPGADSQVVIDWAYVNKTVFTPNCVKCHSAAGGNSGHINVESYANVKANIAKIEVEAITDQSMPPSGALDTSTTSVLKAWIDAGSPETIGVPTPQPVPTPIPAPDPVPVPAPIPVPIPDPIPVPTPPAVVVDYAYVNRAVFTPYCTSCHSLAAGNRGGINLETYANIKRLLKKIKREAVTDKSMPPDAPLADEVSSILDTWITAGAPETVAAP